MDESRLPKDRLKMSKFKLDALLDITLSINANLPTKELLRKYESILREDLGIGKLMLFKYGEKWEALLNAGFPDNLKKKIMLTHGARTILEPSCGDGVFLHALSTQLAMRTPARQISVDAVEIVAEEAAKSEIVSAQLRECGSQARVIQRDIFSWLEQENAGRQWDAILGNPPYIRYQYFAPEQRTLAERLFQEAQVPFSRRTNAWAALVLACVTHLKPGGYLALVLPAELLHIQHASGLRQLLEQEMETITLLNIREMVFPDVLQGVILLLARKKNTGNGPLFAPRTTRQGRTDRPPSALTSAPTQSARIHLFDLDNLASLSTLALDTLADSASQSIADTHGEWMLGLLADEETRLLNKIRAHPTVQPFATFARADIGIVTGANQFFVVDRETLERFELAHRLTHAGEKRTD